MPYVNSEKYNHNSHHKNFFNDVSARAGYMDIPSIKKVYFAVLKTILDDIEKSDVAYLPDFGKLYLIRLQPRVATNYKSGVPVLWPSTKKIRFDSCAKLKKYLMSKS